MDTIEKKLDSGTEGAKSLCTDLWPTDAGCHSDALSPQTLLLMSWLAARIQTKGHTSECPERARPPAFTIHGLGSL